MSVTQVNKQKVPILLFNSPSVRAQIRSTATGAKVKHIASERIYKVKVSVLPVPEQAAIAFVLGAYDDLIAANQRRIQLLKNQPDCCTASGL